ncbi:hypothetical protein IMG5_195930 [Ichthyophthirius multifiliis]|uniref:Uncharacterized protein n=1 Tax=Ichthyophthirius multifiliis TaxID=5932 RepID=G0R509_ICHMU|nr:hypothetical protein IMG5_195930 [Ichthyophthirius multifiliis]EGR27411.1 hypothetical protein IMG5_195930 [Ichthyophthirius multifiliis]|eukprot:XP_004024321.1 hypothetical protein IMG5_195930 [Ichthyophthirius multifiliis]
MNDFAVQKLNENQQKDALIILQRCERMLELSANAGQIIDRNLIIVVLYNRACTQQSLWILDKCSKYIDGVIYNLLISLKEDDEQFDNLQQQNKKSLKEYISY